MECRNYSQQGMTVTETDYSGGNNKFMSHIQQYEDNSRNKPGLLEKRGVVEWFRVED
jgi:hypothetical protein